MSTIHPFSSWCSRRLLFLANLWALQISIATSAFSDVMEQSFPSGVLALVVTKPLCGTVVPSADLKPLRPFGCGSVFAPGKMLRPQHERKSQRQQETTQRSMICRQEDRARAGIRYPCSSVLRLHWSADGWAWAVSCRSSASASIVSQS